MQTLKGNLHPRARISLVGSSRTSGPKVLEGSFPPGSNRVIRLQSADGEVPLFNTRIYDQILHFPLSVGSLQAVVLRNDSPVSPWFCRHITIRADGNIASFKVARWIGAPYESSVYIPRYPSGLELTPQDIDCHTRAADVFEGY